MFYVPGRMAAVLLIAIIWVIFLFSCRKSVQTIPVELVDTGAVRKAQSGAIDSSPVLDQSNTGFTEPFYYNINLVPMGQEFIPQLYALDAVVLRFDDASCSLIGGGPGEIKVVIRSDNIGGRILGTSETVQFPNCFVGIKRFNFPAIVPLLPGQRYVIQPVFVSGHPASMFLNNYFSSYSNGRFILKGAIESDKDLWFEEGIYNFIASSKEQGKGDGWRYLVRRNGTTFKNRGEFMKYINKGE
jgi:hypothetical protein